MKFSRCCSKKLIFLARTIADLNVIFTAKILSNQNSSPVRDYSQDSQFCPVCWGTIGSRIRPFVGYLDMSQPNSWNSQPLCHWRACNCELNAGFTRQRAQNPVCNNSVSLEPKFKFEDKSNKQQSTHSFRMSQDDSLKASYRMSPMSPKHSKKPSIQQGSSAIGTAKERMSVHYR